GRSIAAGNASFYDRDSRDYDALRFTNKAGRTNHESQIGVVASLIPESSGRSLEAGSGTGRFTNLVASRSDELVLVDIAAGMLKTASQRAPSSAPLLGSATSLPLQDASFDFVLCLNVLNHIKDYDHVLAEFRRVLRPGGFLLTNFNNLTSVYGPAGA